MANTPSFRFPNNVDGKDPKQVGDAIRLLLNKCTDYDQAFTKIGTSATSAASTTTTVTTTGGASETVIIEPSAAVSIGAVNNQTGVTSYTTLQSDYGSEIQFDDPSAIAVTLSTLTTSPGIQLPWYTTVNNLGSGTVTLTPPSPAEINGTTSLPIPSGTFAIVYYDGTNFTAVVGSNDTAAGTITGVVAGTGLSGGGSSGSVTLALGVPVTRANGGLNSTSAGTGILRDGTTPAASELSGDVSTSGSNAATLATVNSSPGTYTNANITVNGKGLVTAATNGSGGGGYLTGSVGFSSESIAGTYTATATVAGAVVGNAVLIAPNNGTQASLFLNPSAWVSSANTVTAQVTTAGGFLAQGLLLVVFP